MNDEVKKSAIKLEILDNIAALKRMQREASGLVYALERNLELVERFGADHAMPMRLYGDLIGQAHQLIEETGLKVRKQMP